MKRVSSRSKFVPRKNTLVIAIPDLQMMFDTIINKGGITLTIMNDAVPGVRELVLVTEPKLDSILHELGFETEEARKTLN